jgi:Ca2+-transporting ATPase
VTKGSSRWLIRPVHGVVPGRTRVALDALRRRSDHARAIEDALMTHKGVDEVRASPATGTVLVHHQLNRDQILRHLEDAVAGLSGQPAAPSSSRDGQAATNKQKAGRAGNTSARKARRPGPTPPVEGLDDVPSGPAWHTLTAEACGQQIGIDVLTGLTADEALLRRQRHGPNALPESQPPGAAELLRRQVVTAPVGLLAGSAGLSVLTGAILDALAIGSVVATNTAVGFATERQAERVIRAMATPAGKLVNVLRDGVETTISVTDVVPGDLLMLTPGVVIAADARLVQSRGLFTDESVLTGESLPVQKQAGNVHPKETVLAERTNMVWRGTTVTGGSGLALVVQTGLQTEMGRLHAALGSVSAPTTPMQRQLDGLGTQLAVASIAACAAVGAIGLARGLPVMQVLRTALSLGVAAVPEGLPAVATTTLALGIREMRRRGVSVRRLDAVETLGSLQVVCLDKTGTLTRNRMAAVAVALGAEELTVMSDLRVRDAEGGDLDAAGDRALRRMLETLALCRETQRREEASPTERALLELADAGGVSGARVAAKHPRLETVYRSAERHYMATLHEGDRGGAMLAIKGSPAQVLELCGHEVRGGRRRKLTAARRATLTRLNGRWAARGLRVIAVARATGVDGPEPVAGQAVWQGLVGLADPLRPGMQALVAEMHGAGLRTVMITGDQGATAAAVGRELGLSGKPELRVLEAGQLSNLEPAVLAGLAHSTDVFARVSPADKLEIVRALQDDGLVVGMTGDGINDGPALKAADVGVAMGGGHSEIAGAIADVVADDDKLATLIDAIAQGRGIYANIRKSIHYLLSTNFSEIEVMLAGLALGMPQPLNPLQLLWINLVTDVFPALALALERPEEDVLAQPPRDPDEPVVTGDDLRRMLGESAVISVSALAAYRFGLARYGPGPRAGTLAFSTLTAAQLIHAYVCRRARPSASSSGNWRLDLAVGGSLALQGLALLFPPTRRLLGAARPGIVDLAVTAAGAIAPAMINRALKERRAAAAGGPPVEEKSS